MQPWSRDAAANSPDVVQARRRSDVFLTAVRWSWSLAAGVISAGLLEALSRLYMYQAMGVTGEGLPHWTIPSVMTGGILLGALTAMWRSKLSNAIMVTPVVLLILWAPWHGRYTEYPAFYDPTRAQELTLKSALTNHVPELLRTARVNRKPTIENIIVTNPGAYRTEVGPWTTANEAMVWIDTGDAQLYYRAIRYRNNWIFMR